jgi:hypothetical protein
MARLVAAVLILLCPLLAGCGSSTVTLRHPESGVVVHCSDAAGEDGQKRCIDDFKSQGFEPVPGT